jgi:hypothetical protein
VRRSRRAARKSETMEAMLFNTLFIKNRSMRLSNADKTPTSCPDDNAQHAPGGAEVRPQRPICTAKKRTGLSPAARPRRGLRRARFAVPRPRRDAVSPHFTNFVPSPCAETAIAGSPRKGASGRARRLSVMRSTLTRKDSADAKDFVPSDVRAIPRPAARKTPASHRSDPGGRPPIRVQCLAA